MIRFVSNKHDSRISLKEDGVLQHWKYQFITSWSRPTARGRWASSEHSRATYFDISSNTFIVLAELRLFIGLNHVLALIPIKLISLLYLAQPSTNIWLRNTYIVANSHRLCKSVVCKSGILFTAVLMTYIWKQQQTVSWCLCKPNNSWSSVFLRVQSLLTVVTD